jgi:hypothetical protein
MENSNINKKLVEIKPGLAIQKIKKQINNSHFNNKLGQYESEGRQKNR